MIARLKTLVDAGRCPHALVIEGGAYEARLMCARELASAILGETEKVMNDIHPDVITILPDDKKKTLGIDVIRKMRDDAYIIPNESEKKVYIIAKAELMVDKTQNALLKILEEPPHYATFILLCDTHSTLIETVLSRVALFSLGEDAETESDEAYAEYLDLAKAMASKMAAKDRFGLLDVVSAFDKSFDKLTPTLDCLSAIVRDALIISAGGSELISGAPDCARDLARALTTSQIISAQEGITEIGKAISIYANNNLTLTRLVSKLIGGQND